VEDENIYSTQGEVFTNITSLYFGLYTIDPIYDKVLEACLEGVALHGIRVMDQKMKVKIILEENQVAISQTFVTSRFFFSQFCDVAELAIIHKMI
jgi:hypothetical protein